MKLAIRICGTAKYLHVWKHLLRRVVAAASHRECVKIIYVSDQSEKCKEAFETLEMECPASWEKEHRALKIDETFGGEKDGDKIKSLASNMIARLHGEGFAAARLWGADQCWTVEPDVLPPPRALEMMEWALAMPNGGGSSYFDVAFCTYPNSSFIGGFGDIRHNIAEDIKGEERVLPDEIQERWDEVKQEAASLPEDKKDEAWRLKVKAVADDIKKCPPKYPNLFERWAKQGYRRGGWMESAHPTAGRGTGTVEVDWCGEGCNLLSRRALATAFFEGYAGGISQDLHLCWKRYFPEGIRIACIPHVVCDHVKLLDGKTIHYQAYHEQEGEARGHLRMTAREWVEV